MRDLCVLLFFILIAAVALADEPGLPDRALTPGVVLTTDTAKICEPGYPKSVRHTSLELKREIYREYGVAYQRGRYEVDHLIPLSIGGADVRENLWPQPYHAGAWDAEAKDRLEWKLHRLVCHDGFDVREAQRAIAGDWIAAYKRFCPGDRDCAKSGRG